MSTEPTLRDRQQAERIAELRQYLAGADIVITRRYVCVECCGGRSVVSGLRFGEEARLTVPACWKCKGRMLTDFGARA